jgi:hypothetical protein
MIKSAGVTENMRAPHNDVIAVRVAGLGLDRLMFEATDSLVFTWYVKTHRYEVFDPMVPGWRFACGARAGRRSLYYRHRGRPGGTNG